MSKAVRVPKTEVRTSCDLRELREPAPTIVRAGVVAFMENLPRDMQEFKHHVEYVDKCRLVEAIFVAMIDEARKCS